MSASKGLRVNPIAEQTRYRNAVAEILDDIKRESGCDWIDIAESIGVSLGTISNAANRKTDLTATFLMRLGQHYGAAYLNPYLRMADAQAAPIDGTLQSDILPLITALTHKIAMARDPAGPGGATEVPQERRGYLPELRHANHATGKLISQIEAANA